VGEHTTSGESGRLWKIIALLEVQVSMKRKRVLRRWHNGFVVVITRHDEGDVYRAETGDGKLLAWVGTAEEAEARAGEVLREAGHLCSDKCSEWTAIPQPEPLSELQKKNVAACFRLLKHCVATEQPHANSLKALQNEYFGGASDLVDVFDDAPDKGLALEYIEAALLLEIESCYWPPQSD
jgi:hypothetical protein